MQLHAKANLLQEGLTMACGVHLNPWYLILSLSLALQRPVVSMWVSLTTLSPCKWPLSTVTDTEGGGGQQRRRGRDLFCSHVGGEESWQKVVKVLTFPMKHAIHKFMRIRLLLLKKTQSSGFTTDVYHSWFNWGRMKGCNEFETLGFLIFCFCFYYSS